MNHVADQKFMTYLAELLIFDQELVSGAHRGIESLRTPETSLFGVEEPPRDGVIRRGGRISISRPE